MLGALTLLLLPLLASCATDAAPSALDAARTPGTVWPKPQAMTTDCSSAQTLSLRGAEVQVEVQAGQREPAARYVEAAWRLAREKDWSYCTAAAGGPVADQGAVVSVTVQDASCVSPACYTADTDESYSLDISTDGINITAGTVYGVNWAFSTLASLAAPSTCKIGCLPISVEDSPRFGHRGILLDTSRNWFSVEDIKRKILDPMHATKLNVLHWHVYDSQSQPLESKSMPKLWQPYTPEQAYTQEQAAELIEYAFQRGIRVLPEMDMPGHTAIFAKAFPEAVSCLNALPWDGLGWELGVMCNQPPCGQLKPEEGAGIAVRLLQEMVGLFPNSIFSTGADEVNFNCWHGSVVPKNSSEYAEFQGASLKKLQTFQSKVAAAVTGANRTFAVWDESYGDWPFAGTPALPNGSVLFVWQHQDSIANMTRDGYNVVAVPSASWYLDCGVGDSVSGAANWCAPMKNWTTMYGYDPAETLQPGSGGVAERVLGGEAAMWSEHLRPAILDYVVWPRAAAVAERLWSPAEDTKSAEAARPRLEQLVRQLEVRGLRPSSLDWDGLNERYNLLPQWCDTVTEPVVDSEGTNYCADAASYADIDLSRFENLIEPPY